MNTPKLSELRQSFLNAFEDNFGTINRGLKSFFTVISTIFAGKLRLIYLFGARIQKNTWPDQAESELYGGTLERFGRAKLGRDPFPASQGIYLVDVTGVDGGVIQAGTIYKSTSGYSYSVESSITLSGESGQITVRALTPGIEAQLEIGDTLTATIPILNINESGEVAEETTTPLNAEDIEDYRDKIIQQFRIEAQGGASGDYYLWSLDAQGVQRVFPYVNTPGEIYIYVEATIADSTDGYGTPSQTILDNVEEVVNLDPDTTKPLYSRGRKPLGVFNIEYLSITTVPVDVTISGYTGNVTEAVSLISAALESYLYDIRPYIAGVDASNLSWLYENRLVGVVVDAVGIENNFDSLTMEIDETQISVREFLNGDIPIVGTVTVE